MSDEETKKMMKDMLRRDGQKRFEKEGMHGLNQHEFDVIQEKLIDDMFTTPEKKSGCFIATATYGSPLSKEVIVLKKWRDQTLLNTSIGRNFVKYYYIFSPTIANYIRKSNFLKMIMLYILKPIIKLLK